MSNQKISDQVSTDSNKDASAVDSSQVSLTDLSAATVGAVGSQMTFTALEPAAQVTGTRAHHLTPESSVGSDIPYNIDEIKVSINNTDEYYSLDRGFGDQQFVDLIPSPYDKPAPINPGASISLYEHISGVPSWYQVGKTLNYSHINKGPEVFNFQGSDHQGFGMWFSGT